MTVGMYLPQRVVSNEELLGDFPNFTMSSEAIYALLGVKQRHVAAQNETCADMMVEAAKNTLNNAGVDVSEVDCLLTCPFPPDIGAPHVGAVIQEQLGIRGSGIDMHGSCAGTTMAIQHAAALIETGVYQTVLVLAGARLSTNPSVWGNPMHRFIFADGAGGILLRRAADGHKRLAVQTWTIPWMDYEDGSRQRYWPTIFYPLPWSQYPTEIPAGRTGFFMDNREVFFKAMETMLPRYIEEFCSNAEFSLEQITAALIHQPTRDLFIKSQEVAGVPLAICHQDYAYRGNLVTAELPIALHDLMQAGRLRSGDSFFSLIYGAGFTLGLLAYQVP